jgi:hypothetical protein
MVRARKKNERNVLLPYLHILFFSPIHNGQSVVCTHHRSDFSFALYNKTYVDYTEGLLNKNRARERINKRFFFLSGLTQQKIEGRNKNHREIEKEKRTR